MSSAGNDLEAAGRRVPGRRGTETRRRLLEATSSLLGTEPYRAITVVDIARRAGTSPATFYQYFPDVEQAVLLLAEDAVGGMAELTRAARGDWSGEAGWHRAVELVTAMLDVWDRHRPVFSVMDLAAGEGDARFHRVRTTALNALAMALSEVIVAHQAEGSLDPDIDPQATAGVLVGMLAHVAAHHHGFRTWGIDDRALAESQARLLHWGLTGRPPPG